MARAGLEADPVVPPPPGLGRYLRFARQTPASLKAVARIVERDEAFRARVAAAVDEATVGRAGWLWLTRPEGWEDELAAIEAEHAARRADEEEQRSEREARRKLERAEAAASKARAEAERWRAEAERSRAALAAERRARQEAEARVRTLQASLDDLADDRAAVVRKLKEVEAQLVERATELKALRARRRELEAQLRELRAGGAPAGREGAARGDVTAAVRGADLGAVAEEVARAASGAAELAEALGALARALRPAGPAPPGDDEGPRPAPAPTGAAPAGGPGAAEDRPDEPAPVRRRPVPLPGGIFDDTVEAAEHLLRTPGVVLVVDGYNVSMQGWPELPVAEQRRRLVTGLGDLAARTSTKVEVVFDGAEVGPLAVPSRTRSQVRVRFSAPDVEADDVILDLVGRIPATTPVVVASSDNRVREGARAAGANLVHARQLLALLRR
ncbi:MAG: NYN domain-containing protein [Thermoanaerobacterales bacterium]